MLRPPESMETILDEERRDVLAMLEKNSARSPRGSIASATPGRVSSPLANPQFPVRSRLDIGNGPTSVAAGTNHATTVPSRPAIRSMLDIESSPPVSDALPTSVQASTADANRRGTRTNNLKHANRSDAASRSADQGRKAPAFDPASAYQFSGYLPSSIGGPALPKRNTQGGKRISLPNVMASVAKVSEWGSLGMRGWGWDDSTTGSGSGTAKASSPRRLLGMRSNSPRANTTSTDSGKLVLDSGRVIDMNTAYRHLSDAGLPSSGAGLPLLPERNPKRRASSGDVRALAGARLEDYTPRERRDPGPDSSDEHNRSSDDEQHRGRKKGSRRSDLNGANSASKATSNGGSNGSKTTMDPITTTGDKTLTNGATPKAKYQVRSLLDPEITITAPTGDKSKSSRACIHPNTSFDEGASGFNTPVDSDAEADFTDIKRAQKLSVNMTSIVSTPVTSRCVRTIYRGDFAQMQQEAHDNQRRVRKYMVATDLSDEAAHALEWTIGTVLRDGDTLLAIYCVDEELGIVPTESSGDDSQLQGQTAGIAMATKPFSSTPALSPTSPHNPLSPGIKVELKETSASPMGRGGGKAEQERYRAVRDITDIVAKLLRKTKLQVKVVIEVIHCKSPKHLITEVIDYINPTLVILGSRGRSALKGVILGSFSNYLVTKSSVPVMVARKRLRKHNKYKRPAIRLANNLANPAVNGLASAKID